MHLWILWVIGIVLLIVWAVLWRKKVITSKWKINFLICICVFIVGGIPVGWFSGSVMYSAAIDTVVIFLDLMILGLVGSAGCGIVYLLFYFDFDDETTAREILFDSDYNDEKTIEWSDIILFVLVLILSSIFWFFPYNNYESNIERINETIVENETKQELIYFCNIPVQEISGSISGSSALGFGSVEGNITTSNEFAYIYENAKGDGIYNSVPVGSSKLRFIKDGEMPYVVIITHKEQLRTINHNKDDEEKIRVKNEWKEYIFYLPESVKQFGLG